MKTVDIGRDIHAENLARAQALREGFEAAGVRVIGLLGSPGSGKTTLLENILPTLTEKKRVAVIEGDIATENDANRIRALGVKAVQISTGGACHLDAAMLEKALSSFDWRAYELILVENVGNLVCPIGFPLGETLRLCVLSAVEGEDKPLKYPSAALRTDAMVVTKTDMAQLARVNPRTMAGYAKQINPKLRVFFAGYANGAYRSEDADGAQTLEAYLLG